MAGRSVGVAHWRSIAKSSTEVGDEAAGVATTRGSARIAGDGSVDELGRSDGVRCGGGPEAEIQGAADRARAGKTTAMASAGRTLNWCLGRPLEDRGGPRRSKSTTARRQLSPATESEWTKQASALAMRSPERKAGGPGVSWSGVGVRGVVGQRYRLHQPTARATAPIVVAPPAVAGAGAVTVDTGGVTREGVVEQVGGRWRRRERESRLGRTPVGEWTKCTY